MLPPAFPVKQIELAKDEKLGVLRAVFPQLAKLAAGKDQLAAPAGPVHRG